MHRWRQTWWAPWYALWRTGIGIGMGTGTGIGMGTGTGIGMGTGTGMGIGAGIGAGADGPRQAPPRRVTLLPWNGDHLGCLRMPTGLRGAADGCCAGLMDTDGKDQHQPRLVVVRHGETQWSQAGRHTGTTDVPLTADGEHQAVELGEVLRRPRWAAVMVSPLGRARRTCELAGFADVAVVVPELAEWDYGAYEGRTTDEIAVERPGWSLWRDGVERGETLAAVGERADEVVVAARRGSGDTLAFAHGHILRVLAARWLGLGPEAGALFALDPCGVGVLGWEHRLPAMTGWNVLVDRVAL